MGGGGDDEAILLQKILFFSSKKTLSGNDDLIRGLGSMARAKKKYIYILKTAADHSSRDDEVKITVPGSNPPNAQNDRELI